MLTVIATPIGNLEDISLRALDGIKKADLILCEDTRISRRLLKKYKINRPLESFHAFSEKKKEEKIITKLKEGKNIALISDAGTPGICDPGGRLIEKCREEQIPVTTIPGPSAIIAALSLYGGIFSRFQFVGFLPKKIGSLQKTLQACFSYPGLSIAYETPYHLCKTLKIIQKNYPQEKIFIARELTKIHEECIQATAEELLKHFEKGIKGEIVMIFPGGKT